jgi:UDP-3-O-[3-hydroxymyristoyl] glucosamine N-acyltransferase
MGADPRFFERLGPLTARELADRVGCEVVGDGSTSLSDISTPQRAGPGDIFFLTSSLPPEGVEGAVAIASDRQVLDQAPGLAAALIHSDPKLAYAQLAPSLYRLKQPKASEGFIAPGASVDGTVQIGPGVVVSDGAVVEANCEIGAGAVIGPGVHIGANSRIGARAVLQCCIIGRDCEIYSGAVLGEAGFGLTPGETGLTSLPHFGRVILEDDVLVGALCTIDRGMLDDTVLERNVRIDNHCHIAHNVRVGQSTLMAAFAGISGSVTIGKAAQLGGRVGVADHLTIGDGARLAADAAIMRDVPAGEIWAGSPGQPIRSFMRETAWIRRQAHSKPSSRKKD